MEPFRPHITARWHALLLAVALVSLIAACGGDADTDDDAAAVADDPAQDDTAEGDAAEGDAAEDDAAEDDAAEDDAAEDDAAEDDAAEDDAAEGDAVVATGDTDLGTVLTTADGLTLYGFTNDSGGTSSCAGDCAQTWPPLLVDEGFTVAAGLDSGSFSTTEREDGGMQLVVGDWPLYTFASDEGPGDVNGQGVGGVWFAVTPDGDLIEDETASRGAAPGSDY